MKNILVYLFIASLFGCASAPEPRTFSSQLVTAWKDADGKIHLKGYGGNPAFVETTISEPRQKWPALGWGGASR